MSSRRRQIVLASAGVFGLLIFLTNLLSASYFLVFTLGATGSLALVVVSVAAITGVGWTLADSEETLWEGVVGSARRVGEWAELVDPKVVVEGAVHHRDFVWVCQYRRDGSVEVTHRACPDCQIEVVERHHSLDAKSSENAVDGGVTRDVLACPHCVFFESGEKHERPGEDAVRSRFRGHIEEMRRGDGPGMRSRYARTASALGAEPSPADVWDEYVAGAADEMLRERGATTTDESSGHPADTYPAFADLQRQRDVRDRVVQFLPGPLDWVVAELSLSEYLDEKQQLRRSREAARRDFRTANGRFRSSHGDVVSELTRARQAREWPDTELSAAQREQLQTDCAALEKVRETRERYLTGSEVRRIEAVSSQCESVRDYDEFTTELRVALDAVEDALAQFERAYSDYEDHGAYLDQRTERQLLDALSEVGDQIESAEATLEGHFGTVPGDVRDTLDEYTERAVGYSAALDAFEAAFVAAEREAHPDVFEVDGEELNPEQARAVVRDEPHNLVDASAGTGKTLSLTQRFCYLYRTGTRLDDIVALTYTGEATGEMTERLGDALDGVRRSRLQVTTINGLARSIVERSIEGTIDTTELDTGREAFLRRAFDGDEEFRQLAPQAMDAFAYHREEVAANADERLVSSQEHADRSPTDNHIRKVFETARNFGKSPAELRATTDRGDLLEFHLLHATAALADVYGAVADDREHPIDHTNSIERATALLERYEQRYADEYEHVLVDEFQDLSPQTIAFVQAVLGPDTHLYAVGDDWQSIFGFQGASPAFFRDFESRFEQTSRTTLERNYRCPEPVVDASVSLVADSPSATGKPVEAAADGGPKPVVHRLERPFYDRQGEYIADLVEAYVAAAGKTYADVQVLVANKQFARERVGSHLRSRGIPADVQGGPTDDGPAVRVQTLYKSKGTQAECVVLANAVDDEYGGLPEEQRDPLAVDSIRAESGDHYEEQRRLCYVGMTRTTNELHVVTCNGSVSRFIESVSDHFEVVTDEFARPIEGTVTDSEYGVGNRPHSVTVDCGRFETGLVTFEDDVFADIEEGGSYRFGDVAVNDFNRTDEFNVQEMEAYTRLDG